jgi:hypothetical protein
MTERTEKRTHRIAHADAYRVFDDGLGWIEPA